MSDYIIVRSESTYHDFERKKEDKAITKFEAKVKKLLDEGYSLGSFHGESSYTSSLTQVMYKTSQPPLQSILESLDHTLKYAPIGLSLGTAAPEVLEAQRRVNGSQGGRRITNSSRPRRARPHSASRPRSARPKRRSKSRK